MYIDRVPNRNSPPAILVRESFRHKGKVCKRTIANISKLPSYAIDSLEQILKGKSVLQDDLQDCFEIKRSLPHGHVAAILGVIRKTGLDTIIDRNDSRQRSLAISMIVSRILSPESKLATSRELSQETATSTLNEELEIGQVDEDDLYEAMDWIGQRQQDIERKLAEKHLKNGSLVLYDVSSTYFEGKSCPLAKRGHSRDGDKGSLQIVFGLLCTTEGCPVAVEVFEGNTADPRTLSLQIQKVRERFGLKRVVFVGDRGTLTSARIEQEMKEVEGLDWITALKSCEIRELTEGFDMTLFDKRGIIEIEGHEQYPGERLIVCYNPFMAERRKNKREELLKETDKLLDKIEEATKRDRRPLRGKDTIGIKVGKVIGKYKMAKHYEIEITDSSFHYTRKEEKIQKEASLDGIYVIRTSVQRDVLDAEGSVKAYKSLSEVERAFRSCKTVDLKIRPIYHHLSERVRAHVFLCMLAYYIEWHMRGMLAPILFDDADAAGAEMLRESVVGPAQRSQEARDKSTKKTTAEGLPVHSFQSLLKDLGTVTRSTVELKGLKEVTFTRITQLTQLQEKAFQLLGIRLNRSQ